MAVERRIGDIDIGVILRRDVVVLLRFAVGADRIDLLRIGVAKIVEVHHLLQGVEHAVVQEGVAYSGVAQGRRLEHAAELRLVGDVLANGTANAEIEIGWILGIDEREIARRTQRFILRVGEHWWPSVRARLGSMAAGAIGFLGIVEQAKAAQFSFAQARFTLQPVIILAGIGMEARLLNLIAPDREQRLGRQQLCVLENSLAEQDRKLLRIWRMPQFLGNDLEAATVHLARVEQRTFR